MVTDDNGNASDVWLSRPLLLLVVARAVNQLGAFSLPFLAVLLVAERGATLTQAGLVVAVFGVATIPSRLAGGHLATWLGGRPTMVLGLVLCATAQLAIAAATSLGATLVAVSVLGLAYELYEPASQSMIADLTAPEHRPRAFGLFGAALALGGLAGGLLAVAIGGRDLRLLFVADAASCLVAAVVVSVGLPRARPADHPTYDAPAVRPWRDRRLLTMLAVGTGFATLYLQLRITLPLTLVARGVAPERFGLVLAVSSLTIVLGQPLMGWSRLPRDPFVVMTLGYAVLAVGLAGTAFATSLAGFVAATIVWSVGDVLLLGHPFAIVADLAPAGGIARYLAVFGTCWGIAGVLAPVLGATVLTAAGPTGLWLSCAVAAAGLAAVQPVVRRQVRGSARHPIGRIRLHAD